MRKTTCIQQGQQLFVKPAMQQRVLLFLFSLSMIWLTLGGLSRIDEMHGIIAAMLWPLLGLILLIGLAGLVQSFACHLDIYVLTDKIKRQGEWRRYTGNYLWRKKQVGRQTLEGVEKVLQSESEIKGSHTLLCGENISINLDDYSLESVHCLARFLDIPIEQIEEETPQETSIIP
ncbi:hypothetical protein [Candidatus Venteria ishoeyi]|uniref:Uncharacterized protein n=1 Tax=Candidatus Venteria ishoeyi TaxID=1899563 RepID=A0A1H6FAF7_9GAMM|nr:hypothetical protein [Candidatus Venteria ishoeyi]SEH05736.1 Uncharacterised protein [Candidatus Venteria ishoeyi]SEH05985.1 Uncharacterised protein [Candidatus Venteria ishoeyi]